jgi:hypothetical protein
MGAFRDERAECCLAMLAVFGLCGAWGVMHAIGSDLLFNSRYSKLLPTRDFPDDFLSNPLRSCASFVLELFGCQRRVDSKRPVALIFNVGRC